MLKRKNSVPSRGLDKGVFTVQLRRSILGTTEQWATLDKSKTTRSFWLIQCQVLIAVYPFILPPLCSQDPDFFQAAIGHVLQGMSYPLECPGLNLDLSKVDMVMIPSLLPLIIVKQAQDTFQASEIYRKVCSGLLGTISLFLKQHGARNSHFLPLTVVRV